MTQTKPAKVYPNNHARRGSIMNALNQLEDLRKQATVERSHFYVGNVVTNAIEVLYALLAETPE